MVKGSESVMKVRQFLVYGRKLPTSTNPNPEVIICRVFGKNEAFAKSQFWKINRSQFKMKKATGEILKVKEIYETNTKTIKNYGILFKYQSTVATQNVFKEFRDFSLQGAINQLYNEMAGRHKCSKERINIIKTCELGPKDIRTRFPRCGVYANSCNIKFPLFKRSAKGVEKRLRRVITPTRPVTFMTGKSVN